MMRPPLTPGHAQHVFASSFTAYVPTVTMALLSPRSLSRPEQTMSPWGSRTTARIWPCRRLICLLQLRITTPYIRQRRPVTLVRRACISQCNTTTLRSTPGCSTTPPFLPLLEPWTTTCRPCRKRISSLPFSIPRLCNSARTLRQIHTRQSSTVSRGICQSFLVRSRSAKLEQVSLRAVSSFGNWQ